MRALAPIKFSRQQATGLREINKALLSRDQGTQQNAAMVEESNSASHSLAIGVDGFDRLRATFKTGALANWHTSCCTA